MTPRTAWRWCVMAGILVLALTRPLDTTFPKTGDDVAEGYGTPVIAFEMASTPQDLVAVFGPSGDPRRPERLDGMDAGNRWDFAFMAAYGLFICCFFLAAARQSGQRFWWIVAALGVVAALADGFENMLLLSLTAELRHQDLSGVAPELESLLTLLAYPVWIKFLSLMVTGWGAGAYLLTRRRTLWTVLGCVVVLAASTVALGFYEPSLYTRWMGPGIGVVWVVQLVFAVVSWRRVRRVGGTG